MTNQYKFSQMTDNGPFQTVTIRRGVVVNRLVQLNAIAVAVHPDMLHSPGLVAAHGVLTRGPRGVHLPLINTAASQHLPNALGPIIETRLNLAPGVNPVRKGQQGLWMDMHLS